LPPIEAIEAIEIEHAWRVCSDLFAAAVAPTSEPTESRFREELLFCLLGGFGISFELALSAYEIVDTLDPFGAHWSEAALADRIERELRKAQFEPRTASGVLRRYRFPASKARLIAETRGWLLSTGPVLSQLAQREDEQERRTFLEQCPGVGPKTASWILRNLGLASSLAILDVHVLRVLETCGRITDPSLPRDYLIVEQAFAAWCSELGASPAAFDLFLWEWQRGTLRAAAV
jgi:N-glycosylase/DNA lyase